MQVTNKSKHPMKGLKLTLGAEAQLYHLPKTCMNLPLLVPGLQYRFQVEAICKEPEAGLAGDVSVRLIRTGTCVPAMCAVVGMPLSETDEA